MEEYHKGYMQGNGVAWYPGPTKNVGPGYEAIGNGGQTPAISSRERGGVLLNIILYVLSSTHACMLAGLLTVEAKQRLTLQDLSSHPWLRLESTPSTPLQTSCVLGHSKTTASALKQTFRAFYQATKAGFTLGDVSRAPLAKRRKNKRVVSDKEGKDVNGSVSSLSTTSSFSDGNQTPSHLSTTDGVENSHTPAVPLSSIDEDRETPTLPSEGKRTSAPHLRPSKLDLTYC